MNHWATKRSNQSSALLAFTKPHRCMNGKESESLAGRKRKRKEEENKGWVRGSERMCVCDGKRESKKSDSLAREQNPRTPHSLQSAGLMHIQLSISPHCPSFLINALLVGVNKHIHSGPKNSQHTVSPISRRWKCSFYPQYHWMCAWWAAFHAPAIYIQIKMYWPVFKGIK